MSDPVLRMLEALPEIEPDKARGAQVRARCRETLRRQQAPRAPSPSTDVTRWEPALVAVCFAYLIEVAREVWRMYRM